MSEDLGSAAVMGAAGRTGALKARALYTGRRSPATECKYRSPAGSVSERQSRKSESRKALMGVMIIMMNSYHRVVPPGEDGEAVLVLSEQLLDLRPHAFGLTLQQDEDGPRTQLQQRGVTVLVGRVPLEESGAVQCHGVVSLILQGEAGKLQVGLPSLSRERLAVLLPGQLGLYGALGLQRAVEPIRRPLLPHIEQLLLKPALIHARLSYK
ncbi:hypothetical protein EYF80_002794 [Liparis tanakae]|uniref:Uncharacterized protein n=1 Tax=Liparis tanakae TaxID=230148 RepID=A0A4Z2J9Z4_9TELE|nr:hypothetical protein EYF80_002794 [Liparis tanakae]